jgi:hypothetical protein
MRKTFVLLWCALVGCSIIPDDAFEEIPKSTLQKVTITSNLGPFFGTDLVSESLVGTVSASGSKRAINFTGNLDPFWFKLQIKKIEYELNSDNSLSSLVVTFYNDSIRTENFTYNSEGKLLKSVLTSEDYESTLDFFYVDNILDRIDKKVDDDGEISHGFLMKVDQDDYQTLYVSVFPYDNNFVLPGNPTLPIPTAPYNLCDLFDNSNPNFHSWSIYTISDYYFNFITPEKAPDLQRLYVEKSISLEQKASAISGKTLQKNLNLTLGCDQAGFKLNYVQVIPDINNPELKISTLFNSQPEISETMAGAFSESNFTDVQLKYEYSYDK